MASLTPGHTINPEHLVQMIKGVHAKALVMRMVEPLVGLRYSTFSSKASNYIVQHHILTIHLAEDVQARQCLGTSPQWGGTMC